MPIFPRFVPQQHNQTMDLNTLLSLLGDHSAASTTPHHYNQSPTHASAPSASHPAAKSTRATGGGVSRAFTPNFDIFETATEYVLEGELPGLADKKAIDIEFTDHQTLLVKGRIEKQIHTSSAPAAAAAAAAAPESRQIEAEKKPEHDEPARPHTPPRPTVEDDIDEDDRASTAVMTPASTVVSHTTEKQQPQQPQKPKEQIRYWVSERTIGSFQRTFSFPGLIDQENVKARLENGLLTIVVPKRTKVESRRIEIQ